MREQYDCRRDDRGWTVFDCWTGKAVVLGAARQTGMSWADALALIARLNQRQSEGDRTILQ